MSWFGSKKTPKDASADPVGVVGGYDYPPGPVGATGYPGSGPAAPPTHSQAPYVSLPISDQAAALQINPDEFYGGFTQGPPSAELPVQKPRERRWYPRLSTNDDCTEQRNTTFYGGRQAQPDGQDRFVYGGYRSYAFERPIPLTRNHLRQKAGAGGLDGTRFYMENQGQGSLGAIGKSRGQRNHRPTVFTEPAPWSANYYDTTASTGTPDQPGTAQPYTDVYVSPNVSPNTNGGTWRQGG